VSQFPNPELIVVERIIGKVIGELLAKEYGTATIELKCQGGQIVAMKHSVEQSIVNVHKMSHENFDK